MFLHDEPCEQKVEGGKQRQDEGGGVGDMDGLVDYEASEQYGCDRIYPKFLFHESDDEEHDRKTMGNKDECPEVLDARREAVPIVEQENPDRIARHLRQFIPEDEENDPVHRLRAECQKQNAEHDLHHAADRLNERTRLKKDMEFFLGDEHGVDFSVYTWNQIMKELQEWKEIQEAILGH
jgi:hypothetical protein